MLENVEREDEDKKCEFFRRLRNYDPPKKKDGGGRANATGGGRLTRQYSSLQESFFDIPLDVLRGTNEAGRFSLGTNEFDRYPSNK